jgi:hypothetical protein
VKYNITVDSDMKVNARSQYDGVPVAYGTTACGRILAARPSLGGSFPPQYEGLKWLFEPSIALVLMWQAVT